MQLNRMTKDQLIAAHRQSVESGQHQLVIRDRVIMDERFDREDLAMILFVNCRIERCRFSTCDCRGWEVDEKTEVSEVTFRDCGVSLDSFSDKHGVRFESSPAGIEAAPGSERRVISSRTYTDERIDGKDLANVEYHDCVFNDCVFISCDMSNLHFVRCRLNGVWVIDSSVRAGCFGPGQDVHFIRTFRAETAGEGARDPGGRLHEDGLRTLWERAIAWLLRASGIRGLGA